MDRFDASITDVLWPLRVGGQPAARESSPAQQLLEASRTQHHSNGLSPAAGENIALPWWESLSEGIIMPSLLALVPPHPRTLLYLPLCMHVQWTALAAAS